LPGDLPGASAMAEASHRRHGAFEEGTHLFETQRVRRIHLSRTVCETKLLFAAAHLLKSISC
jgi:hypothetical protein